MPLARYSPPAPAHRMSPARALTFAAAAAVLPALPCLAQNVAQDDIVVGWSLFSATATVGLFDSQGQVKPDEWNDFSFVQSVTWDNTDGIAHNPNGNLIGGNFGTSANGGAIYVFRSGNAWDGVEVLGPGAAAQNSFLSLGLTTTRLGGVSVSPDNTMIAFAGNDSTHVYVLDYDAASRTVIGGRQTTGFPLPLVGATSGTAWLDNNTLVAVSANGDVVSIDPVTMSWSLATFLPGANLGGSQFTSIAYSPEISDYIYLSYSNFSSGVTTNLLFVVDPSGPTPWPVVKTVDLSTSAGTMREIALDSQGNLFFTTHGGIVQKIVDVRIPANISDNSSLQFAALGSNSSFSGIDVAHAGGSEPACYANCDNSTVEPVLNVDDFTCFINEFAAAQSLPHEEQLMHYANCDGSTVAPVLNVDDFTCFINEFAAGCP